MSVDDVSTQIASIRNSLQKSKFLQVTTKIVALKKMLKEFNKESLANALIHDVAELAKLPKAEQKPELIEKKLTEIDVEISGFRQL
ncbi:MAG: hypothetical protein AABY01_02585 [Nanoarchaeota archaeon]